MAIVAGFDEHRRQITFDGLHVRSSASKEQPADAGLRGHNARHELGQVRTLVLAYRTRTGTPGSPSAPTVRTIQLIALFDRRMQP